MISNKTADLFVFKDSSQYNSIPRCVDWSPLDNHLLAIGKYLFNQLLSDWVPMAGCQVNLA